MSNVIPFPSRKQDDPYLEGAARCMCCAHEWRAVAPIGADFLECPDCHSMKGVFIHPVLADQGDCFFGCSCGCEVYSIYTRGGILRITCINCGTDHTDNIL